MGRAQVTGCDACPACRVRHCNGICLRKVGKGIPSDCPRADYGKRRWVADKDLNAGHVVHASSDESSRLYVRQVEIGVDYNAHVKREVCHGCQRPCTVIKLMRDVDKGDEIVCGSLGAGTLHDTLVITWDGGGNNKTDKE